MDQKIFYNCKPFVLHSPTWLGTEEQEKKITDLYLKMLNMIDAFSAIMIELKLQKGTSQ